MRTLIAGGFVGLAMLLAPGAAAQPGCSNPCQIDVDGTHGEGPYTAIDSYDTGSWFNDYQRILDEDGAHPGTMEPAGPAHTP